MAVNWEIVKARYLQSGYITQMNSLIMNLTRLQALVASGAEEAVAYHLVRESQFFIEWSVSGVDLESDAALATELVSLQRQLSRWKLCWTEVWNNELERKNIVRTAQHWCEQLQVDKSTIAS